MAGDSGGGGRRWSGIGALVVAQIAFGSFPLLVHWTVGPQGFTPQALFVWRVAVGAGVLGPVAWFAGRRQPPAGLRETGLLALASLLGITLNMWGALEGVARTSVVHAGLLFTLIPVFTYALALLVRQEGFSLRRAVGIGVALAGALLLVTSGNLDPGPLGSPLLGDLLIVGNSLSYAAFLVLARSLLDRRPALWVLGRLFLLALPWAGLVALVTPLAPAASPHAWAGLAGILGITTVLAYLANTFALARVAASTAAAFVYLQPLIAGLSGIVLREERPGASAAWAAILLLGGLGLVLSRPVPRGGSEPRRGS